MHVLTSTMIISIKVAIYCTCVLFIPFSKVSTYSPNPYAELELNFLWGTGKISAVRSGSVGKVLDWGSKGC